jgi:hypothetical protein
MTTQKHTPTPWLVYGDAGHLVSGADDFGVCQMDGLFERRRADAALIVRAVNSFDAMKKALEEMLVAHSLGIGVGASERRIAAKEQARAALRLAEEGK